MISIIIAMLYDANHETCYMDFNLCFIPRITLVLKQCDIFTLFISKLCLIKSIGHILYAIKISIKTKTCLDIEGLESIFF